MESGDYRQALEHVLKLARNRTALGKELSSFIVAVVHPGGIQSQAVNHENQAVELTQEQLRLVAAKLKGKPFTASHGVVNSDKTKGFEVPPMRIGEIKKACLDSFGRLLALIKIDSTADGLLASSRIAKDLKPDVSIFYWVTRYDDEGKMGIDIDHVSSVCKGNLPGTNVIGYFPKSNPENYRLFEPAKAMVDQQVVSMLALAAARSGCPNALRPIVELMASADAPKESEPAESSSSEPASTETPATDTETAPVQPAVESPSANSEEQPTDAMLVSPESTEAPNTLPDRMLVVEKQLAEMLKRYGELQTAQSLPEPSEKTKVTEESGMSIDQQPTDADTLSSASLSPKQETARPPPPDLVTPAAVASTFAESNIISVQNSAQSARSTFAALRHVAMSASSTSSAPIATSTPVAPAPTPVESVAAEHEIVDNIPPIQPYTDEEIAQLGDDADSVRLYATILKTKQALEQERALQKKYADELQETKTKAAELETRNREMTKNEMGSIEDVLRNFFVTQGAQLSEEEIKKGALAIANEQNPFIRKVFQQVTAVANSMRTANNVPATSKGHAMEYLRRQLQPQNSIIDKVVPPVVSRSATSAVANSAASRYAHLDASASPPGIVVSVSQVKREPSRSSASSLMRLPADVPSSDPGAFTL